MPLHISKVQDSDTTIVAYLRLAVEAPNPDAFLSALGVLWHGVCLPLPGKEAWNPACATLRNVMDTFNVYLRGVADVPPAP